MALGKFGMLVVLVKGLWLEGNIMQIFCCREVVLYLCVFGLGNRSNKHKHVYVKLQAVFMSCHKESIEAPSEGVDQANNKGLLSQLADFLH